MRKPLLGAAVLLLAAVPGCSEPLGRVYGTVKYQGKPLPGATVTFFGPNNKTYTADTGPDGHYELPAVARGPLRVSVQLPPPRPTSRPVPPAGFGAKSTVGVDKAAPKIEAPPPTSPRGGAAGSQLPAKYADPKTSEISLDLSEPEKQFDIDLK